MEPTPQDTMETLRTALAPELELIRLLGEGSVGLVFLAREPALRRLVAVKLLRSDLAADEIARRRFEREAKAAASVSHANVTAVHRVAHLPDGRPFIVMEHIEGRTLEDLLAARGPQSVEEAGRVLVTVAAALAAAHRQGVVHRDIRPANVMEESETGRIVLLDFGTAALLETASEHVTRLTRQGMRLGNPRYMSPEQLRGEQVTTASDVWGLGVLGYELITGASPFDGSTTTERLKTVLAGEPPALSGVDPGVERVLRRCLAREPRRRPRAAEVAHELQQVLAPGVEAKTADAAPGPLRGLLRELERRRVYRVAVAYIAGGFLVLQGADLIAPVLMGRDPDFWYRVIAAVVIAGFPVALILSWVFDIRRAPSSKRRGTSS